MPPADRRITAADILPDAAFGLERKARRQALLPLKRLRRVDLGPYCTFYFESFDTMLFQIQEMLLIEKGGAAQLQDELAAYNPLVPNGSELVCTIMFEIDDELRRATILARLGGIDDRFFLQVAEERVFGAPEEDIERTRDDGKTSSVHFMHFPLTEAQKTVFRDPAVAISIGADHELYGHMAQLSPATRAELAKDFS
jgi:hypothetical protein